MGPELIAETDDTGRVLWVWIMEPGARRPRPVQDFAAARQVLTRANCHGASVAYLEQWFAERGEVEAAPHH
ncbi:hypothetical protein OCH239_21460 [Roseivivax halodurans JCM 10272]|uniref:Uncharacterized protein n=1 Tax=Roseivivax halodurans JCM 10272 TaxID=1449350 RepID=X7E3X2_9RHOB|nr:hypothetical protein [Roseivivax halodurans]ETX10565.1 hypothetical protein OCH239_21460 [Roseivivax halodurans JCM 10272]